MQRDHIVEGWWQMPGKPAGAWPGTKNGRDHRVCAVGAGAALIETPPRRRARGQRSSKLLKKLVAELGLERATPHDLRRTCLTTITRLGFGRDAMDRIANHKKGGVTDVYDRHGYADEDRRIMVAAARHIRPGQRARQNQRDRTEMTLNLATNSEHAAAAMNLAATPSKFKLTFCQLRAQGIRRLTVRCRNFSCEHVSVFTAIAGAIISGCPTSSRFSPAGCAGPGAASCRRLRGSRSRWISR